MSTITMYPGETKVLDVVVTDAANTPVDLSGADLFFCVRDRLGAPDLVIEKNVLGVAGGIVIIAPFDGTAQITIDPADTEFLPPCSCVYDLWVKLGSGDQHIAIKPSLFEIKRAVTLLLP